MTLILLILFRSDMCSFLSFLEWGFFLLVRILLSGLNVDAIGSGSVALWPMG